MSSSAMTMPDDSAYNLMVDTNDMQRLPSLENQRLVNIKKERTSLSKSLRKHCSIKKMFPFLNWLPKYKRTRIMSDMIAGASVGVVTVAKSIAFAQLAGVPARFGINSAIFPALFYVFFSSAAVLGVGPSPVVFLLNGEIAVDYCETMPSIPTPRPTPVVSEGDYGNCSELEYVSILRLCALIQGIVLLTLGTFRLGFVMKFFSSPILASFLTAAAITICFSQLKYLLFATHKAHQIHPSKSVYVVLQELWVAIFDDEGLHVTTILFSLAFAVLLILLKKQARTRKLYSLIMCVVSTVVTFLFYQYVWKNEEDGLYIVGEVTFSLKNAVNVDFLPKRIQEVLLMGKGLSTFINQMIVVSMVGFLETLTAAKVASKRDSGVSENQELRAIGLVNIIGSFFSCLPIMGSLSHTAGLSAFGGKTPMANLISALVVLLFAFLDNYIPLFTYMPKCVLALLIISVVYHLFDFREIPFLNKGFKREMYIFIVLFVVTLFAGIDIGLEIAIIFNLISLLFRTGRTRLVELGRIPDSTIFVPVDYVPRNSPQGVYIIDNVMVVRFQGPLFFGNCHVFEKNVLRILRDSRARSHIQAGLIIDFTAVGFIDASGCHSLHVIGKEYQGERAHLVLANVNKKVMEKLEESGFIQNMGQDNLEHFALSIARAFDILGAHESDARELEVKQVVKSSPKKPDNTPFNENQSRVSRLTSVLDLRDSESSSSDDAPAWAQLGNSMRRSSRSIRSRNISSAELDEESVGGIGGIRVGEIDWSTSATRPRVRSEQKVSSEHASPGSLSRRDPIALQLSSPRFARSAASAPRFGMGHLGSIN